jgi:hypothetical protein
MRIRLKTGLAAAAIIMGLFLILQPLFDTSSDTSSDASTTVEASASRESGVGKASLLEE